MKKLILFFTLIAIAAAPLFSFSEESRADLRKAADWWESRADKLNIRLGELERENPDPSNPKDKNWQEYLKVLDEIKTAEKKQKLYRETARFNYTRSIMKDTVQVYKPAADFMEFTISRGVEVVNALISQSWQDLVKIAVDSVLRTRIRAKIRSTLDCKEPVKGLENWFIIMSFGGDPWNSTVDQALLNWAKGEAQGKALLLSLQAEQGRQIYKNYLKSPSKVSFAAGKNGLTLKYLETATKVPAEEVMNVLGLGSFVFDIGTRLWLSLEMNDSINETLGNLVLLRKKYKENKVDLSCEDLYLVWSKQKTIDIKDPKEQNKLEDLKTGLDFFLKKIPGWYKNKTVPDHFDEIIRMIPVAEHLGDYTTAENLRDILVEFEYKAMTPEEIKASEKESLIEETRTSLLSNLKVLKNFLEHKNYEEVDSKWNQVEGYWEELINLGYNVDTDAEIQGLWKVIKPLLDKMPSVQSGGEAAGDQAQPEKISDMGITVGGNNDTGPVSLSADEYRETMLQLGNAMVEAIKNGDNGAQQKIEVKGMRYYNLMEDNYALRKEVWNDEAFKNAASLLSSKINNAINDALMVEKEVYASGAIWLYDPADTVGATTSNSGF